MASASSPFARIASRLGEGAARAARDAASASADPDACLAALSRALSAARRAPSPRALERLARLFAISDVFPRVLASRPGLLRCVEDLADPIPEKPAEAFAREVSRALLHAPAEPRDAAHRRLRRYKYRELLRITLRDALGQAAAPDIGRVLAALADGLVQGALAWAERALASRHGWPQEHGFCVLGLGKLGGEDLNYSSDVDLLYAYRADGHSSGGPGGALPNPQWYARLAEALTQALAAATPDGFCYRVDLNLRPQGRSGAIARSVPSMLAYYEALGRTWERSALVKARLVAGDAGLARELLSGLSPFVWRRALDLSAVDALRELKAQIDLRGKASGEDLKLGPGGIREVEFFASALQLVHGGKDASLRERNTLRALGRLRLAGHVSARDAEGLADAYAFLRQVENRLQAVDERQTHQLPPQGPERDRLARGLGFDGGAKLAAALDAHRRFVQRAFSTVLGQTARDEVPDEPLLAVALDPGAAAQARQEALARRGFEEPEGALGALERLARVPDTPFSTSGAGLEAVRLLAEIVRTPAPDEALGHFARLISELRAPAGYLALLSRDARARRRLFAVLAQSEYLAQSFLRHPELLDALVQGIADEPPKPPERIRAELAQRAERYADPEERLGALRRYKNEELLRIGLQDIHGELAVPEVASQLTAVADAVLDDALFLAESELRARWGQPGAPLSVVAMGKLGGRELGYHSDLDLLFVYGGAADAETSGGSRGRASHREYFAKLVQRLLAFLQAQFREGRLYEVDTRLRPSGHQGPLVVSEEAFREHHLHRAQLWERQALVKARGAAGDLPLFARLQREIVHPLVYERPLPEGAAQEIARLRDRMEKEVARESRERVDVKAGQGGLVDVEFAVQYLQLRHGGAAREVRTTNTLEAIAALQTVGALSAADAAALRDGYLFLRRVENRLRLVHGRSLSELPTSGRPRALLARRLGYSGADPGGAFWADYCACAGRVREVYARVLASRSQGAQRNFGQRPRRG